MLGLLFPDGLDARRADLVFTDPPYGRNYGGGRAAGSTPKGARVKAQIVSVSAQNNGSSQESVHVERD